MHMGGGDLFNGGSQTKHAFTSLMFEYSLSTSKRVGGDVKGGGADLEGMIAFHNTFVDNYFT